MGPGLPASLRQPVRSWPKEEAAVPGGVGGGGRGAGQWGGSWSLVGTGAGADVPSPGAEPCFKAAALVTPFVTTPGGSHSATALSGCTLCLGVI